MCILYMNLIRPMVNGWWCLSVVWKSGLSLKKVLLLGGFTRAAIKAPPETMFFCCVQRMCVFVCTCVCILYVYMYVTVSNVML